MIDTGFAKRPQTWLLTALLACLSLSTELSTWAAETNVGLSCEELNQRWRQKYYDDFHVAWKLDKFSCPSVASSIAEAMYELDHSTFLKGAEGTIPDFYSRVTSLLTRTEYQTTNSTYPTALATCGNGVLTLYKLYFKQDLEFRTAVLVHEARHSESDDPGHVDCNHGEMKKYKSACDAEFFGGQSKGGAYNYEFNFYWWVRDSSNRTDLSKEVAKAKIKNYILNRYNKISNDDIKKFE